MKFDDKDLKLIYILKNGYNAKGDGIYEFIFSTNPTNIDIENWGWDISPAINNAQPPTEEYYDSIINLKTGSFNLFCLHEAVDREYMHGYHTIHALAYEIEMGGDVESYDEIYAENDLPLLVFHYGMSLARIKDLLDARKIVLNKNEFVEVSSVKF